MVIDPYNWLPAGTKIRLELGPKERHRLYHILHIIEDERCFYAVVKSWWKRKQRWHLEVLEPEWLLVNAEYVVVVR